MVSMRGQSYSYPLQGSTLLLCQEGYLYEGLAVAIEWLDKGLKILLMVVVVPTNG